MTTPRPDERPYDQAPPEVAAALGGQVPTVQQWQAISHPLTPCSVIAGAGSGKTAVMAARVVFLALARLGRVEADHAGALPSEVLCLTFTNKAAAELARRVARAIAGLGLPEEEQATVLTYHAFASRLLEELGMLMGLDTGLSLLSEAQRWQLGRALLDDMEFEHNQVRTDFVVGEALVLADQCANHLREPREVAEADRALAARAEVKGARGDDRKLLWTSQKRAELADLAQAFQDRKRAVGAIDYGDQISLAYRLVREHPEAVDEFRARYPVVLLDEYQDTNVAQARLLQTLCGRGYPVFAVGDPDQNIYAWRGASLTNLLRFHHDFDAPDGERPQRPLYVNFRSGSRILASADRVIGKVPGERRAEDKELRPHPGRGHGRVQAFVATDARAEARQIAAMIREEVDALPQADDGLPRYGDVAILCRKSRLFDPIAEVLREEGIPVEVVDLGGLLKMPEVVEATAWLRLLDDPAHNVSLARILQGPRWRIGYRDLAALARWSAMNTGRLRKQLPDQDDDMPGDVAFAMIESLDHLDDPEMEGLSHEALERLQEFRGVLAQVRAAARGPLGDVVSAIIDVTGLLAELEASASPAAVGSRRNLLNFVQHVSMFAPVEGEASLSTLIAYLDTAVQTEDDLERAQPSQENTVKMMTIHKAKGLEWPVVFVPGLAEHDKFASSSIFPDTSRQANPATRANTMPFELRGDADMLPAYGGNIAEFRAKLTERGLEEERRLCYVALTRARDVLVCSAAGWYEGPQDPHRPGTFYREVADHPDVQVLFEHQAPEESPLLAALQERVSVWPPPVEVPAGDQLFPEGWPSAARRAAADSGYAEQLAASLGPDVARAFREMVEADRERVSLIRERTRPDPSLPVPATLSVSSVIDYARCPKLFFWSRIRPLPRRSSEAARLGTEVHRWIELQARGQATLLDVEDLPDLSTDERLGEPGSVATLRKAFKESRFAEVTPLYTERPFLLSIDGFTIGGRIDAVFGAPDGPWEVVDYKTGRAPKDDALAGLQLDLYALACHEVWGKGPQELTLTYFYLGEGKEVTRQAGDPTQTRERVLQALSGMAAGAYEPTPGSQCRWCDFLPFCEPGRKFVDQG